MKRDSLVARIARSAISDIRAGKNLDSYIVTSIGLVLALLAILGVASVRVVLSALLAAIAVILLLELERVHSFDKLNATLRLQQSPKMANLRDEDYAAQIRAASKITFLTLMNYRFLASNSATLSSFLANGGKLRELIMDFDSPECMYIATTRAAGASQEAAHTRHQAIMTVDKILELARDATTEAPLEARKVPFPTAHIISWFEFDRTPDVMYVTPSGFQQRTEARPTLVIQQDLDPIAYEFFRQYVENLWNLPVATKIE